MAKKTQYIKCIACRDNVLAEKTKLIDLFLLCTKHRKDVDDYLIRKIPPSIKAKGVKLLTKDKK